MDLVALRKDYPWILKSFAEADTVDSIKNRLAHGL